MAYLLESSSEYERLNRQSRTAGYDFRAELVEWLEMHRGRRPARILDAGCGSGIVTAYLAQQFPDAEVHGCDRSEDRVSRAREEHASLSFELENLAQLSYADDSFDLVVCRYVVQHLSKDERLNVLRELLRVLKPGGNLFIVDGDGIFFNLYPMPASLKALVDRAFDSGSLDLHVGRKLPSLLHEVGFERLAWDIETMNFRGELLWTEQRLTRERLETAKEFLGKVMGSVEDAARLKAEYLEAMAAPGAVMFVNKFYVSGFKPA